MAYCIRAKNAVNAVDVTAVITGRASIVNKIRCRAISDVFHAMTDVSSLLTIGSLIIGLSAGTGNTNVKYGIGGIGCAVVKHPDVIGCANC